MKLSTYTLLVSATTAVQMRSMMEPPIEPETVPADTKTALECFFEDDQCKAINLQDDQTDTCLDYKDEESCNLANEKKEETELTDETDVTDVLGHAQVVVQSRSERLGKLVTG